QDYTWIKQFDPKFNVRYRDDKSYPYLAVTLDEEYPRLQVMRGAKRKGVRYFGPYSHAWAIRETLDLLLRVFPVRTCSAGVFKRAGQIGRPCLLGYIGKCSAPCVGRISEDGHRRLAEEFCDFMAGQTARFTRRLEAQVRAAAGAEEFERAARPGCRPAARGQPAARRRPARAARRGAASRGRCSSRSCRRARRRWRSGWPRGAAAGSACGCRAGATRRRCWRPWRGTPGSRWPSTRCGAPATCPPAAAPCTR